MTCLYLRVRWRTPRVALSNKASRERSQWVPPLCHPLGGTYLWECMSIVFSSATKSSQKTLANKLVVNVTERL